MPHILRHNLSSGRLISAESWEASSGFFSLFLAPGSNELAATDSLEVEAAEAGSTAAPLSSDWGVKAAAAAELEAWGSDAPSLASRASSFSCNMIATCNMASRWTADDGSSSLARVMAFLAFRKSMTSLVPLGSDILALLQSRLG